MVKPPAYIDKTMGIIDECGITSHKSNHKKYILYAITLYLSTIICGDLCEKYV